MNYTTTLHLNKYCIANLVPKPPISGIMEYQLSQNCVVDPRVGGQFFLWDDSVGALEKLTNCVSCFEPIVVFATKEYLHKCIAEPRFNYENKAYILCPNGGVYESEMGFGASSYSEISYAYKNGSMIFKGKYFRVEDFKEVIRIECERLSYNCDEWLKHHVDGVHNSLTGQTPNGLTYFNYQPVILPSHCITKAELEGIQIYSPNHQATTIREFIYNDSNWIALGVILGLFFLTSLVTIIRSRRGANVRMFSDIAKVSTFFKIISYLNLLSLSIVVPLSITNPSTELQVVSFILNLTSLVDLPILLSRRLDIVSVMFDFSFFSYVVFNIHLVEMYAIFGIHIATSVIVIALVINKHWQASSVVVHVTIGINSLISIRLPKVLDPCDDLNYKFLIILSTSFATLAATYITSHLDTRCKCMGFPKILYGAQIVSQLFLAISASSFSVVVGASLANSDIERVGSMMSIAVLCSYLQFYLTEDHIEIWNALGDEGKEIQNRPHSAQVVTVN